ncbi:amino acid transporter [Terasakiispira papahanaumokuakeensis]|uniref:Amino acid transporter n=1 Tax=Terasakiispira papahanaumokuakeensis TaxID=197479 RepID=A0A1E2V5Z7_9GAMM|nr:APC family permease [Terasakiispira papahanaumokuakeensis]ODC02282.1 amino acid transporter [Terasakiispira papahanaumokuakeensis]
MTDTLKTGTMPQVSDPTHQHLGFKTMIAICIGTVVVQGAMASALLGFGIGGLSFLAAMLVATLLAVCNAMSFSELSLMYPQAGTLATYTQKAIGHFPAIVSVFAGYVVVAIFAIPAEFLLVDALLQTLFPETLPSHLIPVLLLATLALLNILGTDVFAKLQNVFTFAMVVAIALVGVTAMIQPPSAEIAQTAVGIDWGISGIVDGSFIGLVALAMWMFVGCEFVCPMISDIRQPEKRIPRAMFLSLGIIFVLFSLFCLGAGHYLSAETLTTSPLPYLDLVDGVFGKSGLIIATVMGITATCSTVNTVLAAVPRMMAGMADNGQAFGIMGKRHPRYDTPWVGIVFLAAGVLIPFLLIKPDQIISLVIAAATSWLLAYIVAHIDVMVLRRSRPQHRRPYRTPFYPLPQIVGIAGMAYVAANASPSPDMTALIYTLLGVVLGIVSLIAIVWVKFKMKKGLFEPDLSD